MSRSFLFGFPADPADPDLHELWVDHNSSGTAMTVWTTMTRDWQHRDPYRYTESSLEMLFADADDRETAMSFADRVMVFLTGWQVYIPKAALAELPTIIRRWREDHGLQFEIDKVDHWPAIADCIEGLDLNEWAGLGIWLTTTMDNPYSRHVSAGYDRFFRWQESHLGRVPIDELPLLDLDYVRSLAAHLGTGVAS